MGYYIQSTESNLQISKKDLPKLMNDMGWQDYTDLPDALEEEMYTENDQGHTWDEDDTHFHFLNSFAQETKGREFEKFFPALAKYITDEPRHMEFLGEDGAAWRTYLFKGKVQDSHPRIIWSNPFLEEDEEYGD